MQAVLQATVAPDHQGRVFALIGSLAGITAPVGLLFAAPIAQALGVRSWYLAAAAACIVMGLAGGAMPGLWRIEDAGGRPETATEPPAADLASAEVASGS